MLKKKIYPWHNSIYKKIIMYYKNNVINKSIFIYSLKGNGTNVLLKNVSAWLICKKKKLNNCGLCNDCNLFKTGNHPDYYIIKNNKKNIDINYINELFNYISIKSQENSFKIIYLPKIELFTKLAIYKLIKLLKTNKKKIFFIIKCNKLTNLILNLKKICFNLNLNPPKEKISLKWLKQKNNNNNINEIKTALYLNNYAPLSANKMLSSNIWQLRKNLYNLIYNELINKNELFLFEILELDNLELYIYWIYTLITDIIKLKYNCKYYIINKDQEKIIIKLSNIINLDNLFFFIKKLNKLQYKIKNIKNINIKILLIEQFIYFKKIINFLK
ncbi:MAG: hypothetical protein NW931_00060 [Enterobacteriaceae bacterium PSmelAO3-2]|nr:hypothetical protein MEJ63_00055 [Enterobacteriaceae bacterium Cmel17]WMC17459.1 MAG: DNA polymerase III subunit delta' C-terminal domain-containing protein [Enterobacteriaceae bacterium Cmel21]WMC17666.1 MAG: hypothetical protein NW931_00060 [Enterobacteriaceae bacterium PSmelAO3-2]WMC17870.1 MAG: hypothetical protein NW932_00060 [Enterobacteriaceae bacterium PSmelAO3-1]WMC18074.1 MAG: hypothetical protein NW935_00060 [Enterobacteriaceae bacterium PSmelAO1]